MQSTSDLDYFHARDLPCSHVKSHDDPISDCRVDSTVLYCIPLYIDGVRMCIAVGRLRLVLNAEEYEYTDLASHGTGLRIVFHSHDERPAQPEIVRGVMLSTGTHAHVNFRSPAVRRHWPTTVQFCRELASIQRT